jgi:hypothetical protein
MKLLHGMGGALVAAILIVAAALSGLRDVGAQTGPMMERPSYTVTGALVFPTGYREWQFVTAGHGMNYSEDGGDGPELPFDNVFVQREAYAAFKTTGHWPEGTMLALEIRGGTQRGSINKHGSFQAGPPHRVELHVRDQRFKGGWAFFAFEGGTDAPGPAAMIDTSADCYSCHEAHAAVDTTFVQFYPTLLPVAQEKGTLSAAFLAEEAAAKK